MPARNESIARLANLLPSRNAAMIPPGTAIASSPQRMYIGLILSQKDGTSGSVNAPNMEGTNASNMIVGRPIISHHLSLPLKRNMQNDVIPASTRMAVNGDAVRVRMNVRMAMPIRNINHPDRPSL